MELVDSGGRQLHAWRVSFNEIWPTASHLEEQPHDWDVAVGRAFEVAGNGDVVWQYINRCDEVAWISEASRCPEEYAAFAEETCQ